LVGLTNLNVGEAAYPWFYCLDDEDRKGLVNYCEELDCVHEELEFVLVDLETATEFSYRDSLYFRRLV